MANYLYVHGSVFLRCLVPGCEVVNSLRHSAADVHQLSCSLLVQAMTCCLFIIELHKFSVKSTLSSFFEIQTFIFIKCVWKRRLQNGDPYDVDLDNFSWTLWNLGFKHIFMVVHKFMLSAQTITVARCLCSTQLKIIFLHLSLSYISFCFPS